MKLARALKEKNRIVQEINELKKKIMTYNVHQEDEVIKFNAVELWKQLTEKTEQLLKLKADIAVANFKIYYKIFHIAEQKGLVAYIDQLITMCKEGSEFMSIGYAKDPKEIKFKCQLDKVQLDNLKKDAIASINADQDVIDEHNATTDV